MVSEVGLNSLWSLITGRGIRGVFKIHNETFNKSIIFDIYHCMDSWKKHISINPQIRFGKACITGTRIAVEDILNWLSSGMSNEEIIADFPQLTNETISAALAYAANREHNSKLLIRA
jgi:uncharacterized protein (DUF433 family)